MEFNLGFLQCVAEEIESNFQSPVRCCAPIGQPLAEDERIDFNDLRDARHQVNNGERQEQAELKHDCQDLVQCTSYHRH